MNKEQFCNRLKVLGFPYLELKPNILTKVFNQEFLVEEPTLVLQNYPGHTEKITIAIIEKMPMKDALAWIREL